jgi:glucose repression regulatory protein TUP1
LKQQLDSVLQGNPPPQAQDSRITSASPSNTPPFLNKPLTLKPPRTDTTPLTSNESLPPGNEAMGRTESSPYPFQRQSSQSGGTLPPISIGNPPPVSNQQQAPQQQNLPPPPSQSTGGNIPSFTELQDRREPPPDHFPPQNRPSFANYQQPPPPQQQQHPRMSMNDITNPQNTEINTISGSMPIPGMGMEQGMKNGKGDNMVKKEGNDWVVVFNPQVQTNLNITLAHNIDQPSVVCCVRFSGDGKYLATGSNKQAQIYDVDSGRRVMAFPANPSSDNKKTNGNHASKNEDEMEDNEDEEKDKDTDRHDDDPLSAAMGGSFEKEDSYVRSVCFSPDNQYLAAGAEDKTVKVWDMQSKDLKYSLHGHELDIYSLDFSPDSRFIVSGSGDGKTKIWNMETGVCDYTLGNEEIGPKEGVTSVAISPDGSIVAAGSLDCVVRLWDTYTGKFLESFKGHDDSVYSVAFSPDGKTLASGSLDRTLRLWDLSGARTGGYKCISTLSGHRDYVLSVAFSPDGKWLMSGSKDRSVQFWDPRSNVLHLMLQGHKNSVISVALNPARPMFATGSGDFRARVWNYSQI